jgi:hypothetical protein
MCLAAAALVACGDDDGGGTPDANPGGPDAAAGTTFTVPLTRAEEVPACAAGGANAMGNATVTINGDGMSATVVVNITYQGLSGAATLGHIHFGNTGAMGNVVLGFTSLASPINQTFTSANYTAAAGAPTTYADFITQLKSGGKAYINIHTQACPGGEIRGQID